MYSGEIIATSHDLTSKKGSSGREILYFSEIQVGEILFHLARCMDHITLVELEF